MASSTTSPEQVVLVISTSRRSPSELVSTSVPGAKNVYARPSSAPSTTSNDGGTADTLTFDPSSYDSFIRVFQTAAGRHGGRLDSLVLDLTHLPNASATESPGKGNGGSSHSTVSSSSTDESAVLVEPPSSGSTAAQDKDVPADLTAGLRGEALVQHLESSKVPLETSLALWALRAGLYYIQKSSGSRTGPPKIIVVVNEPLDPQAAAHRDPKEIIGASSVIGLVRSLGPVHALAAKIRLSLIQQPFGEPQGVEKAIGLALSETTPVDIRATPVIYQRNASGSFAALSPQETNLSRVNAYATLGTRFGALMVFAGVSKIITDKVTANAALVVPASTALVAYLWAKGWIPRPVLLVLGFAIGQLVVGRFVAGSKKGKPTQPNAAASIQQSKSNQAGAKTTTGVFLGSGGHTSEALTLLSALDSERYAPRIYLYSSGDSMSLQKARAFEASRAVDAAAKVHTREKGYALDPTYVALPRARTVGQSFLTSAFTTGYSLVIAFWLLALLPLWRSRGRRGLCELLIVNGPGTCVVVVVAVMLPRLFGLPSPRVIYVESFARVTSLSLSGKILRHVVDRFVTQWPLAVERKEGGEKMKVKDEDGWLV